MFNPQLMKELQAQQSELGKLAHKEYPTLSPEDIKKADLSPFDKNDYGDLINPDSQKETPWWEKDLETFNNHSDTEEKIDEKNEPYNPEASPRRIKTIRDDLEGQQHEETGVSYEKKVVETDTGEKVEGVFPQFESKFDAKIPENLEKASDRDQFKECNRQLKERYDNDPEFRKQFDERQRDDIENGRTPYGYTWHHSEEKGKIQLVDSDIHDKSRHTGGRYIWGGGSEKR